ncbi:cytochrome c3 family protein [Zhongshania borealis]|uniref:Cytochrome c3 family protein n=1 Tax=Zhongshania borealis TaxID=889488 RepID=A0ABP7X273_9GAMM
MLILIRKTRLINGKVIDHSDSELASDHLRVGSGNHCDVQLFGEQIAREHCDIIVVDRGQVKVNCRANTDITIAGKTFKTTTAELGEQIEIGSHKIALTQAPPGFDAAIEVYIDASSQPSVHSRYQNEMRLKLPSSRLWSYLLSVALLAVALIFPLLNYLQPDTAKQLQKLGAPSDKIWSSGPLSSPHHLAGMVENCNSCHSKGFQKVEAQSCLNCHSDTHRHFPANHPFNSDDSQNCQACHKEHNEPEMLIVGNNTLCITCHIAPIDKVDIDGKTNGAISASTHFSEDLHPAFLATLLQLEAGKWAAIKTQSSLALKEASNLKFDHEVHLNPDKVAKTMADTEVKPALICGDCHTPSTDGEHFLPITMETSCASCHSLDFDDVNPQRNLPHAKPEVVSTFLQEFYVSEAARQRYTKPQDAARLVPGRDTKPRCHNQDPLQCGSARANEELDRLFIKGGCVDCHEVFQDVNSSGDQQWQIKEVRLNADWFPAVRFPHTAHQIMSADNNDEESCVSCHQAPSSKLSSDVLMPDIGVCLDCHDETAKMTIELQCIDCHAFHNTELPRMPASKPEVDQ